MTENSDYWKELLGDDYNEELMNILRSPSEPDIADAPSDSGKKTQGGTQDDEDDGGRFYNFTPAQNPPAPEYDGPGHNVPVSPPTGTPDVIRGKAAGRNRASSGKDRRGSDKSDDFDVTFDFDGEYRDVPDNRPLRQRREKRTGCLGGILYAVFIICISLLIASLLWLAATDVLGLGNVDEKVQVTVPQDYTVDSVADMLTQDGLVKYKFLFKMYANFSHATEKIVPGTYELNKNYDYRALVNGMSAHGGKRVEISVTIPEGYTLKQIFQLFEANKVCTEAELWDTAANYDFKYDFLDKATLGNKYRLEGFLFPDTYTFYMGDTPTRAIDKMLANFKSKFKAEYATRAKEMGYSIHDVITVASMIEKESGGAKESDLIASVIYNRLKSKSFPHLEIDATIYYAIAETGQQFSTDIDSPYNTYKVKGLPAGPISNPGIVSIKAALYPQTTKYYFYALNKEKTHNFFKDAASFNAFVKSDAYGG